MIVYNLNTQRLNGECNGYRFQFIQAIDKIYYYTLINPDNLSRMIAIEKESELDELCENPEAFWQKYCK